MLYGMNNNWLDCNQRHSCRSWIAVTKLLRTKSPQSRKILPWSQNKKKDIKRWISWAKLRWKKIRSPTELWEWIDSLWWFFRNSTVKMPLKSIEKNVWAQNKKKHQETYMEIFDPPAQKLAHRFVTPPNHLFRTVSIFLKLDSLRKTRKTHKMKKRLGGVQIHVLKWNSQRRSRQKMFAKIKQNSKNSNNWRTFSKRFCFDTVFALFYENGRFAKGTG